MKHTMKLLLMIVVSNLYLTSALAQSPPAAVPLERVIKGADSVFVGHLVSARVSNGVTYYGLVMDRTLVGSAGAKCLISKFPYKIGVAYIFFISSTRGGCMLAADHIPSGLEVAVLKDSHYIKFSEPQFLYPDFEGDFFSVYTSPIDGKKSFALWTGVNFEKFEEFILNLHPHRERSEQGGHHGKQVENRGQSSISSGLKENRGQSRIS